MLGLIEYCTLSDFTHGDPNEKGHTDIRGISAWMAELFLFFGGQYARAIIINIDLDVIWL